MTDAVGALIETWRTERAAKDTCKSWTPKNVMLIREGYCTTCGFDFACHEVIRCADELEAARTAGGWRDISSAPKDGTHILATNGCFEATSVHWHVDGWYLSVSMHEAYADYEAQWGPLTLWQPLP